MSFFVLGVDKVDYVRRDGSSVSQLRINYFDLDYSNSRTTKGFSPVNIDVESLGFSLSDFPELPGIYNLEFKAVRSRSGRGMDASLTAVNFIDSFILPDKHFLLLGAKEYSLDPQSLISNSNVRTNVNTNTRVRLVKGVKLFILDLFSRDSDYGYQLLEPSHRGANIAHYSNVPGLYDFSFVQIRGNRGESQLIIDSSKFLREFDGFAAVSSKADLVL